MKKREFICFVLVLCCLCGCSVQQNDKTETELPKQKQTDNIKGVWISYQELDSMLNSSDFKSEFEAAADKMQKSGISDAYIHIRAFADAIYKSELFPIRAAADKDFDVLEYMINICHQKNIRFHAWINPYRIKTSDSDKTTLSPFGTIYGWLNDEDTDNDNNVLSYNGLYLNPASSEVRKLIIDGVREVISNYSVDGIHFDDYFYPTTDASFDSLSYEAYTGGNQNPMSLADFRRANVNSLISGCYTAIKFYNKDIEFSISPTASIDKNYNGYFADIEAWAENSCVDRIIPQLYFGFEYPDKNFRFDTLLKDWKELFENYDTKLTIGLAVYKIGTDAEPDCLEWKEKTDILKRQVELIDKDKTLSGYVFFSYSYLFSEDEQIKKSTKDLI